MFLKPLLLVFIERTFLARWNTTVLVISMCLCLCAGTLLWMFRANTGQFTQANIALFFLVYKH